MSTTDRIGLVIGTVVACILVAPTPASGLYCGMILASALALLIGRSRRR